MSDEKLVTSSMPEETAAPSVSAQATPDTEAKPARQKPGRKPGWQKPSPIEAPVHSKSPIEAAITTPPEVAPKTKKQLHEERMHKLWLEGSKMVRGMFRNHEIPGTGVTFPFRAFKQDPVKEYTLNDGQIYELPKAVAQHINNNCQYTIHKHATDDNGKPIAVVGTKIQRFSFYPTEFTTLDVTGEDKPDIKIVTPI
jgi:hypothetical protein